MRRRLVFALVMVSAFAFAALGTGIAAKRKPPKTGLYTAQPSDLESGASYGEGSFVLTKDAGKLVMVRNPAYSAIFFPDVGHCNPYDLGVTEASVAISKRGKFRIKEALPIAGIDEPVALDWKGHWTGRKTVEGTIKVSFKGCTDRFDWNAKRSSAVPVATVVP